MITRELSTQALLRQVNKGRFACEDGDVKTLMLIRGMFYPMHWLDAKFKAPNLSLAEAVVRLLVAWDDYCDDRIYHLTETNAFNWDFNTGKRTFTNLADLDPSFTAMCRTLRDHVEQMLTEQANCTATVVSIYLDPLSHEDITLLANDEEEGGEDTANKLALKRKKILTKVKSVREHVLDMIQIVDVHCLQTNPLRCDCCCNCQQRR